jgi:rhodanese-related sulfurtransferase/predicted transcriptional regulator
MSIINLKQRLFAQLANVGKALSNGNRLELLEFLAQNERSVETLAELANLSVANTSQHLQHLRRAGLVAARKQDRHVFYAITDKTVLTLITALRYTAEKNSFEMSHLIEKYLTSRDSLEPISQDILLRRIKDDLVTVIDVRPAEEFSAGHLPNAINIPLDYLDQEIQNLSDKNDIIAYCRGPYCLLAFEAVGRLRAKGMNARRLEDGFPEWELAGLPIERSTHLS